MINIQELEAAGYRQYKAIKGDGLWSKWILSNIDNSTKLYSVNFYLWKNRPDRFSVEARFYQDTSCKQTSRKHPSITAEMETSFDMDLMVGPAATIADIEAFFIDAYIRLDCIPDPHNQS